jgi:hypothetical protein
LSIVLSLPEFDFCVALLLMGGRVDITALCSVSCTLRECVIMSGIAASLASSHGQSFPSVHMRNFA